MRFEYIVDDRNFYYVPRAKTSCDGRIRNEVFEDELGVEPAIISPTAWALLANKFEVRILEVE